MRFTLQDGYQGGTNRALPDDRPAFAALGQKFHFGVNPNRNQNFMFNGQYDLTPNVTFYAYGHYGRIVGRVFPFYRYGTNTPDPVSPLIASIFPDGFLPYERANSTDHAVVMGLRGVTGGWHWNVDVDGGGNRISYATDNSVNLAMLSDFGTSPTSFHDGILRSRQQVFDAGATKSFAVGWLPHKLNVAFGTQWLRQSYSIAPGDLASYYISPTSSSVPGGAQAFPGWSPADAISTSRHDTAEYAQVGTKLTDAFGVSLAARHSFYSDFGSNTSYSLTGRYKVTRTFALRGTVSTGFRAPTLPQEDYTALTSILFAPGNSANLTPGVYLTGIVPSRSPIASLFGGKSLEPERSHNYTIGGVWTPNRGFMASLDLYQVTVDNTISLADVIPLTSPAVRDFIAGNGLGSVNFVGLQYFGNVATVVTQGADLVLSGHKFFRSGSMLTSTFAFSYHRNQVRNLEPAPAILGKLGVQFSFLSSFATKGLLEDSAPRSRLTWNERYNWGHWQVGGILNRYGRFTDFSPTSASAFQNFSPLWIFNLNASYFLGPWTFSGAVNNVFNTYPGQLANSLNDHGVIPYSRFSPIGISGTEYLFTVNYSW